mmetsp:Transcript_26041/g.61824  ORF Transcript_26041/g.61824 Transcript_26041/m.61824 type:complete len:134 (-) Transcript_26041:190-591(-)
MTDKKTMTVRQKTYDWTNDKSKTVLIGWSVWGWGRGAKKSSKKKSRPLGWGETRPFAFAKFERKNEKWILVRSLPFFLEGEERRSFLLTTVLQEEVWLNFVSVGTGGENYDSVCLSSFTHNAQRETKYQDTSS